MQARIRAIVGRKHDRAICTPRAAAPVGRIADRDHRTAGDRNPPQLAIGKEPKPAPVGGEEGPVRAFGARQPRRGRLVKRANEDLWQPTACLRRHERDQPAIR